MIEVYCEVEESADGKTVTTIYAQRRGTTTVKEELQVNEMVDLIAQYIAKIGTDGTTMVHRPLPPSNDRH